MIKSMAIASHVDVSICFLKPECVCVSQICVEILSPVDLWRVVMLGLGHTEQCSLLTLGHSEKLPSVTQEQAFLSSADLKRSSSRTMRNKPLFASHLV